MIGFMSVEAQAEADFDRARRRAFFGRVVARLRRECSRLLAFNEIVEGHLAHNRHRLRGALQRREPGQRSRGLLTWHQFETL